MDCLYTSFEIADWLLERNTTTLDVMQSNQVGTPPETEETKDRRYQAPKCIGKRTAPEIFQTMLSRHHKVKSQLLCFQQSILSEELQKMTIRKSLLRINYAILPKGAQIL